MIARLWHGYTPPANADGYRDLLLNKVLPGIHRVPGYKGAYVFLKRSDKEFEFITLTLWESMESIRQFAGEDYSRAVIHEEAERLLSRHDERSEHYEATWVP